MAKQDRDPRIGYDVQWPETTMGGTIYDRPRPITTIALGNGYFCVPDTFQTVAERDEMLIELKALVAGTSKAAAPAKKQDKDDDDGLA